MLAMLGLFILCLIYADLIVGHVHWLEDTYCTDGMPWIGEIICDPNIDHHLDPQLMVREGTFISRNTIPWVMGVTGCVIFYLSGITHWGFYLTALFASFGNEVHRWHHVKEANLGKLPAFLCESGIVQPRRQHSLHHKPPFNNYYCVMIAFNNAWMERVGYWRILECLFRLFGLQTKRENRRDAVMSKTVDS